jgi:hypothetical protein
MVNLKASIGGWFSKASLAYAEQLGWNRQPPRGNPKKDFTIVLRAKDIFMMPECFFSTLHTFFSGCGLFRSRTAEE